MIYQINKNGARKTRKFYRDTGKVWIALDKTMQPGDELIMGVEYSGRPRVAPAPPWQGGFTWKFTRDGSPWIATSCQGEGSDIWWPSKDHVSDEPDSMHIRVRVPDPLFCATNGRFISAESHADNTTTYHWYVSTTINIYNVALNIAPYKTVEQDYESVTGEMIPVTFWVLPEDYEKGREFMPQIIDHLRFYEELLGPYPFRADKYGVVQTPHLGMEHQTIIAYGANFNNSAMTGRDWGFDALHHHELAHEWWGNLVTNIDWKDMWIHEGFGSYMQALYVEKINSKDEYFKMMQSVRQFNDNYEIAPYQSTTGNEIGRAPIYAKGAWVLHMLRYMTGDEAMMTILRRMAYPDPDMEKITDGSQTRFVSTADFITIAEKISGSELDWFFDVYTRQPKLPVLDADFDEGQLRLKWKSPLMTGFPMPVEVKLGDSVRRFEIPPAGVMIPVPAGIKPEIDPQGWVLFNIQDMDDARALILDGKYSQARAACRSAGLFQIVQNPLKKLVRHIDYMEQQSGPSEKKYKSFAGQYQMSARFSINIEYSDGHLFLGAWRRGEKKRLLPVSDTDFITSDAGRVFSFKTDENGKIAWLSVTSENTDRAYEAKKVK